MDFNLDRWKRDWALMSMFFNVDEITKISKKIKSLKIQNIVFCSFENRFAKSGGLASVTTNILPYLKEVNNIPSVILITPFYSNIMDKKKLKSTGKYFEVQFNNKTYQAKIYEFICNYSIPKNGSLREYYLEAEGFFETRKKLKDPYIYHEYDSQLNLDLMNENALFFCKAVPLALHALNIRENIMLHLQEWQTALISLTSKEAMVNGTLESCATIQTIHNSYDSILTWELLSRAEDKQRKRLISGLPGVGLTAYQIGLQLVDAPVTTVSEHFSTDIISDILQTEHYAPHLQNIFKKSGVYGVNNGTFVDFSPDFPKREKHTIDEIRKIKLKNRKVLLRFLATYKPEKRFGDLTYRGRTISNLPDYVPILVMSGRLAPLQKGYDIFLRSIEKFREDEIKAVLTPMTANHSDLDYFYEVACKCKGNLTQINKDCGFLYREEAVFYTLDNIRDFIDSDNIVQVRKTNPWAQRMADNLYDVLKKAIYLYQHDQDKYYKLIINGFKKIRRFSWETNAKKYFQVYEMINKA
jgi:glycogen synthase